MRKVCNGNYKGSLITDELDQKLYIFRRTINKMFHINISTKLKAGGRLFTETRDQDEKEEMKDNVYLFD